MSQTCARVLWSGVRPVTVDANIRASFAFSVKLVPLPQPVAPMPNASMREILTALAARYKVAADRIRGQERTRDITMIRQEAMWLMRQCRRADGQHRFSLPQIGLFLGGRDHSTVLHGIRRHQGRLDTVSVR